MPVVRDRKLQLVRINIFYSSIRKKWLLAYPIRMDSELLLVVAFLDEALLLGLVQIAIDVVVDKIVLVMTVDFFIDIFF